MAQAVYVLALKQLLGRSRSLVLLLLVCYAFIQGDDARVCSELTKIDSAEAALAELTDQRVF